MQNMSSAVVICLFLSSVCQAIEGGQADPINGVAHTSSVKDQIELPERVRKKCLSVLRDGMAADEFWPSMHAAEGLTLGGHGDEVQRFLLPKMPEETDAQQRCGLARELVRSGNRRAVNKMLEILASDDPHGHVHAAESLYKVGEVGSGRELRRAWKESDNPVLRIMAAAALGRCGNPQAMAYLRRELVSDDATLRKIAAWVLARIGNQDDIPQLLVQLRRTEEADERAYFQHALAALGDRKGLLALMLNLSHDNAAVRVYAATFAGDARATRTTDKLIQLLEDADLDVRIRAAQSLLVLAETPPPDPDEDIRRQVYTSTEEHPRYTEGSVIEGNDGALLFAVTQFDTTRSDFAHARIVARTSQDGGRTWSTTRTLQENTGKMNVMSVTLRRLRNLADPHQPWGLFFLQKNDYDDLDVYLRISEDDGDTFGKSILITDTAGYHVMNNDRVCRLSTGRLLVPVASTSDVRQENHFVSCCYLSDDGGLSWRRGTGRLDQPQRGAMEPEVVELEDGRVLMIVRTQLGHIAAAYSHDGGNTWGKPFRLSVAAPEAPATLRRIPASGDLLLIWNNNFTAGAGHGGKRTPLTAAISSDEGKTWHNVRNLEADPARGYAYTSLTFVGGRAVLTYYEDDPEAQRFSTWFRSLPVTWFYAGE